ncbi:MAG TPA: phosphate acyltransferase, partial [Bacteroidia bacterium]|nr:phosphate acyltransferase [Bacteroidia bacterium]HMU20578.1 phosphate acyltransferase [Bacteroidia bacterium]
SPNNKISGGKVLSHKIPKGSNRLKIALRNAANAIGPVLLGMKKPVHILQLGSSVRDIVNMVTIAVIDAQRSKQ